MSSCELSYTELNEACVRVDGRGEGVWNELPLLGEAGVSCLGVPI